jgi:hypothetical protein
MNIEILNCLGPPWEVEQGVVKRTGRGESIGAVIHAWKQHKEILCVVIFISNHQKCHVSHFVFYDFSSTNQRIGGQHRFCPEGGGGDGDGGYQWEGEVVRKGVGG